jgi:DNA polymerase
VHRWRDTLVRALAHGLPGSLGQLCELLRIPQELAKEADGRELVRLFCMRDKAGRRNTRATHPAEWARFIHYAGNDILAMREVARRLPSWNYKGAELALWHLDQVINDRGVQIDMALVQAALDAVQAEQTRLSAQSRAMTAGEATGTQRDALLTHLLVHYGVNLPDLRASTVEQYLSTGYHGCEAEVPQAVRDLLQVRLSSSTSSTAKYKTLALGTSYDGRLRGTLQFCGASRTGRWAGRLFQPQNLPRPTLKQAAIDAGIEALKAGRAAEVQDIMALASSALRGTLIAKPGHKLVVSDLSNIEGRVQAWLADETWKLVAFRAFDAGHGPDLYKLAYAKSFGVRPEDVTKDQRQIGKVQELALGYQGGVGAFVTFATAYGIDLDALAATALDAVPTDILTKATDALAWTRKLKRDTHGLTDRAWIMCDAFKRSWRAAHPHIAEFWPALEDAFGAAIDGQATTVGPLTVQKDGAWLRIILPSGRSVCYPSAGRSKRPDPCPECHGMDSTECPRCDGTGLADQSETLRYFGMQQGTRRFGKLYTYGGKIFDNICQALARDVLAANMPAIEAAGYKIVLTVHDEILAETPDCADFTVEHLARLMATPPTWAADMPLAAAGFETHRYKKD